MSDQIAIEIEKAHVGAYQLDAANEGLEPEIFDLKRFDGGIAIATIVLPLMGAVLPFVARIVVEEIRAKRHVRVKVNGIEVQGLDRKDVEKLLADLLPKSE